jgi:hypothetical protein
MVGPLAERIIAAEDEALEILKPDDTEPADWVEKRDEWNYRLDHRVSMLGVHTSAARYGFRQVAADIWTMSRRDVPTTKEHRQRLKRVGAAARDLRTALDDLSPMERVLFAFCSLSPEPVLALDPEGLQPAPLIDHLDQMVRKADERLAALGPPGRGDWRARQVGGWLFGAANIAEFAADSAFYVYKHFHWDRLPSSKEGSPFVLFTELALRTAIGRSMDVRRAVAKFLRDMGDDIYLFY